MKTHSYNDTFETISRYANDSLPLFADGWNRFPGWQVSERLIAALEQKKTFWNGRKQDAVDAIDAAINSIRYYMEKL